MGELTDLRDGRRYHTVEIDGLVWMAENLAYRIEESFCYNAHPFNCRRFGRLYTWWEASQACPAGWRLPDDDDWNRLYKSYGKGNTIDAYIQMVEGPFKAKMGGWLSQHDNFEHIGRRAYFWSKTSDGENSARYYPPPKKV